MSAPVTKQPPAPPLSPRTVEEMQRLIGRYPLARSALLPMLFLVQAEHGYVSRKGMAEVAAMLDLTPAEVAGVATFYTMYKRSPCGRWLVSVCTNVSCDLAGGGAIYRRLLAELGDDALARTSDGLFTLEEVECLGACDGAPVLQVNYENYERLTEEQTLDLIAALRAGDPPEPPRGAKPLPSAEVHRRMSCVEARP